MTVPRTRAIIRIGYLCVGICLALMSLDARIWAGVPTNAEATVSVADLEELVRQIEDSQQREHLLRTLRTLIAAAKQGQADILRQKDPDPLAAPPQGVFLAFGELTQRLASIGRRAGHGVAMLPMILADLPARLTEPTTSQQVLSIVISSVILVIFGIVLEISTRWLEARWRANLPASGPLPHWRRLWLALISVGLAVAPYVALLVLSGIVFSILPVGPIPAGLAALLISTCLVYRLVRAVALALLDPEQPSARLLPISDRTAQRAWSWGMRLTALATAYFVITRGLLTIGVSQELYQLVRGTLIIIIASVLSVFIVRLTQAQRAGSPSSAQASGRLGSGVMAALQSIWPIIAIAYIWSAALLALLSFRREVTFMVAAFLQMCVVVGVGIMLLWAGDLLFKRAVRLNDRLASYFPGLEARTLRYLRAAWWSFRVLVLLIILLSILQVWGVSLAWFLTSPLGGELLGRLIMLMVTVAIVAFVMDLSTFISQKLIESAPDDMHSSKKRKTLVPLVSTVIKYGALFTGGLIVLHQVGVNVTPILAGVGIISLAVGFGAQTLVKDIINGLFILVEDSIAVGDVVTIKGTGGVVEAVNLRTIRLRDLEGSVHIIPNSQVEIITNMTKDYSYYLLDVGVAYREDTDEVIAALREIDAEMRAEPVYATDMLAPIDILGVERFDESAVVIRARLKTKPIRQWSVGREFNRRLKKLFDARGIEIPFPHRKIYFGQVEQGQAGPMQPPSPNTAALKTTTQSGQRLAEPSRSGDAGASRGPGL